jgi:Rps23 Pro-64 3,4-dihydroxylase Tpa1-like proline 4-hydroxylase
MNAHTFGTDGWPHTDTDRTGEQTAILYLNDEWKPEFCGETVIFNQHGDILVSVLPKPNRILAFPANLLHAPRPLSKEYAGLRVVLVVKMALADAQIEANKTELLAP